MKFKFYLSSLVFLLASFFMINAQTNTVKGKITDGVEPLYGVNVVIQGTTTGVITDDNGNFTLSSDQDFPWTLEISSLGFEGQTVEATSSNQNISISLSSGEALDEVVISGSRKAEKSINAASSIQVIGAKAIENKSAFNSLTLLDDMLGVQIDKHGANRTGVALRDNVDLFTTSTLVMLDYRTLNVNGIGFFDADVSNLNNLDLERVEVVLGPASALYGPGVGAGVVHYLSKDPFKHPGTSIELHTGGFEKNGSFDMNMFKMNFRHAVSNDDNTFGYKFNLKYGENEDFDLAESATSQFVKEIRDAASGRIVKTIDGWQERNSQRGADATLYFRPSNNLSITTVAGINEVAANILISSTGETRAQQVAGFVQTRIQSGNLFMQYNYTDTSNPKEDKYRGFNYRTGLTSGVQSKQSQFQLQYEMDLDLINTDLSIGVEHMSSKFDTGTGTFGRFEDSDDYRIYGAYFSAKTKLSDKLNLQLAGRYDKYPEVGESSFAPRAALVYNPNNRNNFRFTFNKAFIAPSALNMFVDLAVSQLPGGAGNVWILGNSVSQTFNNPETTWFIPGLPSNAGIGMNISTAYAVATASVAPLLSGTPLQAFIPFITSQNTLAGIAGLGAFSQGMMLDLNGNKFGPLKDGNKATLGKETHYELGYKGMLSNKTTLSINVYNSTKENFVAIEQISPLVALPNLGADLGAATNAYFTNAFTPVYGPVFGPYYATLLSNAYTSVGNAVAAMGAIGTIQSDQAPDNGKPNVMLGYRNYGKVNYWGFESGLKYRANDNLTLYTNYSVVSQTVFEGEDLGDINETGSWHLNHSKNRVKAGFVYDNGRKWNLGLSYKYDGGFDASMGAFYSGVVESRNIYDANLGYDINPKTKLSMNIVNLTDEVYSFLPNMPLLGRQVMFSLKRDF
ncbi:MAG: TonB-dependent receptor [Flavobacteriaceae bacterium]|nr:TonB-dependent receptor [Flavobacteriaceae bacterium]